MKFTVKKSINDQEVNFEFVVQEEHLDEYGRLMIIYKLPGIEENKFNPNGFFRARDFIDDKKAIMFYDLKVNGVKIDGVRVDDNIVNKLIALKQKLQQKRKEKIESIVNEIVSGNRKINFKIVGCDWPHYQAWLNNIDSDLKGLEQKIMEQAIKKYYKKHTNKEKHIGNSCDFIQNKLEQPIPSIEANPNATNIQYDHEVQEYYGYKKEVITGFDMTLESILKPSIEKEIKEESKKIEEEAKKKREIMKIINATKPHQGPPDTCSYCGRPGATWSRETAAGVKYACEPLPGTIYAAAPSADQSEGCLSQLMREHEAWAKKEGLVRCWECGKYYHPSELDETGYCGC